MFGLCCRWFPIMKAPEELYELCINDLVYPPGDGAKFLEILRYVGFRCGNPNNPKWTWNSNFPGAWRATDEPRHIYTCAALTADGQCSIYENRPEMCKSYAVCEYPDCDTKDCPGRKLPVIRQHIFLKGKNL
jgi:hypothetical protein